VRPPARQSPAGAALRPDWHVRILTGFLAFCTRRTRVGQRLRGQDAQESPSFQPVSARAPVSEEQRRILAGFLAFCTRRTRVPQRFPGHPCRAIAALLHPPRNAARNILFLLHSACYETASGPYASPKSQREGQ
jgi:hypothetical protein